MGTRTRRVCLIIGLLVFSLACGLGQSTPEVQPTPVLETPVPPPTETPPPPDTAVPAVTTPTFTPRPKGTVLEVINDSGRDIWYLFVSPTESDAWGDDRLGGDIVPAGEHYALSGILDGVYDIQARDSSGEVIETAWQFEIDGNALWRVAAEAVLEIYNQASAPIGRLYLSPVASGEWGPDLLEGETIPVDAAFLIEAIDGGSYDIRAEQTDGTLMEIIYDIPLDGNYFWTVRGKTDLPPNAVLRFEDDFSDNRHNWGLSSPDGTRFSPPANGEFCIEIVATQMTAWEWYEPFRPDQFIAEIACVVDAGTDGSCGLGFGPDNENLYWFEISPYGQTFALFLLLNGQWQDSLLPWTVSKNISPTGWNYLSLQRIGGVVSLFINGVLQAEIPSDHFPTGRIGLGGAAYSDGNTRVCLDNLRVWRME